MKKILIKFQSVKWQNTVRNIGHVLFIESWKKSVYGASMVIPLVLALLTVV